MNSSDELSTHALEKMLAPDRESPTRRYAPKFGWYRQCVRCKHIQEEVPGARGFPQTTHFCDGALVIWAGRYWDE